MSRRALYLALFVAGLLLALACGDSDDGNGGGDSTGSPTSVATTADVATVQVDADAGCTAASAFAGQQGQDLDIITPCKPSGEVRLNSGGRITIDQTGEGYLDFVGTVGGTRIWVLHGSDVRLCTEGAADNPTASECINGFAVWNSDNPGHVVRTPNATVTLVGTYVLVGHVDEQDQTIVVPFDGTVLVQGDPQAAAEEGEPVEPGAFWSFGQVEERIAPLEEFPELVARLGIDSWVLSAAQHAAIDGFPAPGALLPRDTVNLFGAGIFGTPEGGDIFLNGIFWEDIGQEVAITALLGSRGPRDVLEFGNAFDPARLEELAGELGGAQVIVYFDSDAAGFVARAIAEQLQAVGFDATAEGVDLAFAREEMNRADEEGRAAILVTGL